MTERRSGPSWRDGSQPIAPLVVLWLTGATFLGVLVRQQAIPYADLLLDPAQYNRRPWYTGLISNVGVLGWTVAAVAAAGGGWLAELGDRNRAGQLLRGGALLSGLLLLDDLFQFHIIVPRTLGAPKVAFYALYGMLGAAWAVSNRAEFIRTRWPLLIAALVALAGSTVVDLVGDGRSTALLTEDSAKFLGILAWALYFVLTVGDIGRSVVRQGRRVMENDNGVLPAVLAFDPEQQSPSTPPKRRRTGPKQPPTSTTKAEMPPDTGQPEAAQPEPAPPEAAQPEPTPPEAAQPEPTPPEPTSSAAAGSTEDGVGNNGGEHDSPAEGEHERQDGDKHERPAEGEHERHNENEQDSHAEDKHSSPGEDDEHARLRAGGSGREHVVPASGMGPTKRSAGLDRVVSWWRRVITLWLPVLLLCYLCYRTAILFVAA